MHGLKAKLQQLYHDDNSKHSHYQNVPEFVRKELGYTEIIDEQWRGDTARYRYILKELKLQPGSVVGDVGANTGFFTLSLGHTYPNCCFIAYEANKNHVEYITMIQEYFHLHNVSISCGMIDNDHISTLGRHDVLFLLNVLHHAGFDFDRYLEKTVECFEQYALDYLKKLTVKTEYLVFQMGYNWGGNKKCPIISREDDVGKIIFTAHLFMNSGWNIERISMATRTRENVIEYRNIPDSAVSAVKNGGKRIAELLSFVSDLNPEQFKGEFYRRPIFICKSVTRETNIND